MMIYHQNGDTALMLAARENNLLILEILLDKGANIEIVDKVSCCDILNVV